MLAKYHFNGGQSIWRGGAVFSRLPAERDLKCGAPIQIARYPPQPDHDAGLASPRGRDCRDTALVRLLAVDEDARKPPERPNNPGFSECARIPNYSEMSRAREWPRFDARRWRALPA